MAEEINLPGRVEACLRMAEVIKNLGPSKKAEDMIAVTLAAEVRRLAVENERLREGLRKIQNHPTDYMIGTDDNMEVFRGIADAALAGEGP